jgi:hypothetical protein
MGAGMSADKGAGSLAELKTTWVLQYASSEIKYASGSSMAVIKKAANGSATPVLAFAFQSSTEAHEGSKSQHLRFTTSKDGGETWADSKCVMWGPAPLWNPILHYDAGKLAATPLSAPAGCQPAATTCCGCLLPPRILF